MTTQSSLRVAPTHLVQLYSADEQCLAENVASFLMEGLSHQEAVLVIASPKHAETLRNRLRMSDIDAKQAEREGRLRFLNAADVLDQFMVAGRPDRERFEHTLRSLTSGAGSSNGIRAYGEMVGLLWEADQRSAAIQLEELWHDFLQTSGCKLFCGYPIDIFGPDFQTHDVELVLQAHTELVSSGPNGDVGEVLNRAMHEVIGGRFLEIRPSIAEGPHAVGAGIPEGERGIRWVHSQLPSQAAEILTRARSHYNTERRFRALVENSSDAICLLSADGTVTYASGSSDRVLGYPGRKLVGRALIDFIHAEDQANVRTMLQGVRERQRSTLFSEVRFRQVDGASRWIEYAWTNRLDDSDLHAIVVNSRDISLRKAAQLNAQRDAEELRRAYADLQSFAYAASHDLREPLRSICAFTELLIEDVKLDEERQQYAQFVTKGIKRMSTLLDALSSWDRVKPPEVLEKFNLGDAVRQAILNLSQAINETSAQVHVDTLPDVEADESQMVQLFQNLIANAIKYRSAESPRIHITSQKSGSNPTVMVKDNGIGIAPEYCDQIFGLFKRLHGDELPGTGIGLALCKKIVEQKGGKIWASSDVGKGATFCFTLPNDQSLANRFTSEDRRVASACIV